MSSLCRDLCHAVHELAVQKQSRHTIHEILYALKRSLQAASAVLVVKDPDTDYLVVCHSYNVSKEFVTAFRREIGTGVIGRVYYQDPFVVVRRSDGAAFDECRLDRDYETAVVVRAAIEERTMGYLAVYFSEPREFDDDAIEYMKSLAEICAMSLARERLGELARQLQPNDPETGLLSYHAFYEKLREELARCHRYKQPLSLAILDIDNYKHNINLYGNETAHDLCREVATELRSTLRQVDILAKYGRDEYIVALPHTDGGAAATTFRRFLEKIRQKKFTAKRIETSLSCGLTAMAASDTVEEILQRAQTALHDARVTGEGFSRL